MVKAISIFSLNLERPLLLLPFTYLLKRIQPRRLPDTAGTVSFYSLVVPVAMPSFLFGLIGQPTVRNISAFGTSSIVGA